MLRRFLFRILETLKVSTKPDHVSSSFKWIHSHQRSTSADLWHAHFSLAFKPIYFYLKCFEQLKIRFAQVNRHFQVLWWCRRSKVLAVFCWGASLLAILTSFRAMRPQQQVNMKIKSPVYIFLRSLSETYQLFQGDFMVRRPNNNFLR